MAFFNDMDRLSLKLLSPSGLELFAKNIQEAFNNGHKYRKIEDHKGVVEYLKAIRDGADGSEELFDEYIKVVDIGEKVTEKNCNNCMNSGIWPSEEPCMSCILSEEMRPNWKPKEDTSEQDKKDINDISEIDRIKHIEDRVESIQANVLVYGNDIVSKIIAIQDKIGMTPDADIYLKDIRQDLCDLDTKLDGLESMLKDIQKTLNEQPVIEDIHRVDEGPAKPEFDIGETVVDKDNVTWMIDKVVPSDSIDGLHYYDCHKLTDKSVTKRFQQHQIYRLGLKIPSEKELKDAHKKLKKMTKSEPKFKVGNIVKYKTGIVSYFVIDVKKIKTGYCYDLERRFPYGKRNYKITNILESRLEEVK